MILKFSIFLKDIPALEMQQYMDTTFISQQ